MRTKGKFILMDIKEFEIYLNNLQISGLRSITHLQMHHTWSPAYRNFNGNNHFEKMESMETEHKKRGFKEIGQHYTTFPDGLICLGRNIKLSPACIEGHNSGGICMEHLGNFNIGGDQMTNAHQATILKMNALLCLKFNLPINTDTIVYHHWFRLKTGLRDNGENDTKLLWHKTCPGTAFFGGNKVQDALTNFLPLIQLEYQNYAQPGDDTAQTIVAKAKVNVDLLNVRSGPSTTFNIVAKLKRDTAVNIYEKQGNWTRTGLGQWVATDYLIEAVEDEPEVETAPIVLPKPTKNGIVNVDVLNVRSGAGIQFEVVAKLKRGDKVSIEEEIGDWDKIGNNQWVFSDYIALT